MRVVRHLLTILGAGAALAAPAADGHAVVQPSEGRPADPQVYRVTVPNELDTAVEDVRLRVPAGVDFLLLDAPPPGWKGEIVRKGDAISELHWSGGEIPPEQYATFRFLMRNPVEEGEISWPIVQRYAGGDVQRWIGEPGSDFPASRTRIFEGAVPSDVVSVHGERVSETSAGAAPAAPAADAKAERDTLTLVLAAAALAVALAALVLTLRRWT